jgi:hypothetical protein
MLSRRRFINALVGLGFLGSASAAPAAPTPRNPKTVRLDGRLSRAVFLALAGETFSISLEHHTVALTLVELVDGPSSTSTEQFTVVFRGPRDLLITDGVYTVRHHTAGSARLFLQPGGHDYHDAFCKAPFNLLR